jgi:hypothetical protein
MERLNINFASQACGLAVAELDRSDNEGRLRMIVRLVLRLVLFLAFPMFTFWVFSPNHEPWTGDVSHSYFWAKVHISCYTIFGGILGFLLGFPRNRVIAICACILFPLSYGLALIGWPGGNDGGGLFWIMVVGPACIVATLISVITAILPENNAVNQPIH